MATDMLNMDKINALPPSLWAKVGGMFWPVHDIDVETGLMRIDVCGQLQVEMFGGVTKLRDGTGAEHEVDDFYNEDQQ